MNTLQKVNAALLAEQRRLAVSRLPWWRKAFNWYSEWDLFIQAKQAADTLDLAESLGRTRIFGANDK